MVTAATANNRQRVDGYVDVVLYSILTSVNHVHRHGDHNVCAAMHISTYSYSKSCFG